MATDAEGRVAKQVGGRGYFAAVHLRHDPAAAPGVSVAPDAIDDYPDWREAAALGAALGQRLAARDGGFVVTQIKGMDVDTNPTLVAIAAMRAVWAAVGFVPPPELAAATEAAIPRAWVLTPGELENLLRSGVKLG